MERLKKWIAKMLCKCIKDLDKYIIMTYLKKDKSLIIGQSSNVFNKSFLERKMELIDK